MPWEETRRSICTDDEGEFYTVIEYTDMIETPSSSVRVIKPGSKRVELEDGSAVELLDDATFRIVDTGIVVRRVT